MMTQVAGLVLLAAAASADIHFTRTVEKIMPEGYVNVTLWGQGCTMDQYGTKECTLQWGEGYRLTILAGNFPEDITTGATIAVDAKIDDIINFKMDCPICGALCEFTIPVIHKKISQQMPPCPLLTKGTWYNNKTDVYMPATSPFPGPVSFKGTATARDGTGKVLVEVSFEGKAS